jgi:hypothetical protein
MDTVLNWIVTELPQTSLLLTRWKRQYVLKTLLNFNEIYGVMAIMAFNFADKYHKICEVLSQDLSCILGTKRDYIFKY